MTSALVGYTGFVGSNLLQFYPVDEFYNSKNFYAAKGKHFSKLFFSGIPAVKWYANKNPEHDKTTIDSIKSVLDTITVDEIILISTIDVYNDVTCKNDEDSEIHYEKNHTYGKNRYLFEEYIKERFEKYHIVRLPGLFGKGLKKNIIFDLINNNRIENIPLQSSFQWYYLDWLKKDIDNILEKNIKVCNLFTEPVHTNKIISLFEEIYKVNYGFQIEYFGNNNVTVKYDTCTKYGKLFNSSKESYIRTEKDILDGLREFLQFSKRDKRQLSVSNICTNKLSERQFSQILKLYDIGKLQIAPTKIIDQWNNLSNIKSNKYGDLKINSFQSITYTLTYNIFSVDTRDELLKHLKYVVNCAENIGVDFLVFGCPKNRKVFDDKKDNNEIFVSFFEELAFYMMGLNLVICIENNSKQYGCNFINTIHECETIVRKINSPNIKMMIDIGNAIMENDNWYRFNSLKDIVYNIDVSNPKMSSFEKYGEEHDLFSYLLKKNNYTNNINLEMLIKVDTIEEELYILIKSLNNFVNIYSR
uniref:Xylose isomerase-like TIM barrel domain-containing protein n=1 Tax=viral metagenome TaxID=1070528 RepID=A0A6C0CPF8_9ZZZZ